MQFNFYESYAYNRHTDVRRPGTPVRERVKLQILMPPLTAHHNQPAWQILLRHLKSLFQAALGKILAHNEQMAAAHVLSAATCMTRP